MITQYSQRDSRWSNVRINGTSSTLGPKGCFITSLGNRLGITPLECLRILEKNNALSKDLIVSKIAADVLGMELLEYSKDNLFGKIYEAPNYDCIMEVDFSPIPNIQQHFVLYRAKTNDVIDSYDGQVKKIENGYIINDDIANYEILNYRSFFLPNVISEWAKEAAQKATRKGIVKDWSDPQEIVGNIKLAYIFNNLGVKEKIGDMTLEEVVVCLNRLKLFD